MTDSRRALLHTVNCAYVRASPDTVYALAADILHWPELLAHYRYVRLLPSLEAPSGPGSCVAEMSATRSHIPVSWTSIQKVDPVGRRVIYRHVGGATTNMDVIWEIDPRDGGSDVRIIHDLFEPVGILRFSVARWVAGHVFIHAIAEQTLTGIRRVAEERSRSA